MGLRNSGLYSYAWISACQRVLTRKLHLYSYLDLDYDYGNTRRMDRFQSGKGRFTMAIESMAELFVYELSVALDAERQISRILPLLSDTIESEQVRQQLKNHETVTIQQIHNIEECFRAIDAKPDNVAGEVPRAIKRELHAFMEHSQSKTMLTVFILDTMASLEQFEITSYQSLIRKARQLGHEKCVDLLGKNLEQEMTMAERIQDVAQSN